MFEVRQCGHEANGQTGTACGACACEDDGGVGAKRGQSRWWVALCALCVRMRERALLRCAPKVDDETRSPAGGGGQSFDRDRSGRSRRSWRCGRAENPQVLLPVKTKSGSSEMPVISLEVTIHTS